MERPKFRNLVLAGSIILTPAILADCNSQKPENTASPAPAATETLKPSSSEAIILDYVKTLPIPSSTDRLAEINNWQNTQPPGLKGLNPDQILTKGTERIKAAQDMMATSKNRYLSQAIDTIKGMEKVRNVAFSFEHSYDYDMQVFGFFDTKSGVFIPGIDISAEYVLSGADSFNLAYVLADEIYLLEQSTKVADSLPSNLSLQEKMEQLNQYSEQNNIDVLSQGYGIEALANIEEARLFGYIPTTLGNMNQESATIIKYGENPTNSGWENYVETIIPRPSQQPSSLLVEFPKI